MSAGRVPARLIQRTLLLPSLRCRPLSGSDSHGKHVPRCEYSATSLLAVLPFQPFPAAEGAVRLVKEDYVNVARGRGDGLFEAAASSSTVSRLEITAVATSLRRRLWVRA